MKPRASLLLLILSLSLLMPIIPATAQPLYYAYDLKGDAVYVGDPSKSGFQPSLKLTRWSGEASLEVGFDDSSILAKSHSVDKETIKWETPNLDLHFYPLEDGFEFEIILKQKPQINRIALPLKSENLVFYYQPPLNEESWPAGYTVNATHAFNEKGKLEAYRPPNVVGSYAVYHSSKMGNEYKTGKAYHIYRPLLIDALGVEAWADLSVSDGLMTITLPQKFLDTAKYPVTVDPTFGKTNIGASNFTAYDDMIWACKYPLSEAGNVTSISVYLTGASPRNTWGGIYDDPHNDAGSLQGESEHEYSTEGWHTWDFAAPVSLTADDWYLTFYINANDKLGQYDSDSAQTHRKYQSGLSSLPDSWTEGTTEDYAISIYVNYTAAGGPTAYNRTATQSITVAGTASRLFTGGRGGTQGLGLSVEAARFFSGARGGTATIGFTPDGERIYGAVRDPTQAIGLGYSTDRAATLHRTPGQSLSFLVEATSDAINRFIRGVGLTIHFQGVAGTDILTLLIHVVDTVGSALNSAMVFVWGPDGTMIGSDFSNETGYYDLGEVQAGNHTLIVSLDGYQTYSYIFNIIAPTTWTATLQTLEEGIMFNIELFTLAGMGMVFMCIALLVNHDETKAVTSLLGAILFFSCAAMWMVDFADTGKGVLAWIWVAPMSLCIIMFIGTASDLMQSSFKKTPWD